LKTEGKVITSANIMLNEHSGSMEDVLHLKAGRIK
jgi:hypothetical protein